MERIRCRAIPSLVAAFSCVFLAACGGPPKPPKRGVIEKNLNAWSFRRYQAVLDVEVWVPENDAAAHTASYVRTRAEKRGRLEQGDVVNAFVTRYERDEGILRALVKFCRRLAQEQGYVVEEHDLSGARLFTVRGAGEAWVMWAAERHIVKIGGRGLQKVPEPLVDAYADRYPSRVRSGMLEGPLPEGPEEPKPEKEPFDPKNPRPEWQD